MTERSNSNQKHENDDDAKINDPNNTQSYVQPPHKKLKISHNNLEIKRKHHSQQHCTEIPKDGWYYKINSHSTGPISIKLLFLAAVEKLIDQYTPLYHAKYGSTKLIELPYIIKAFKQHIVLCKQISLD